MSEIESIKSKLKGNIKINIENNNNFKISSIGNPSTSTNSSSQNNQTETLDLNMYASDINNFEITSVDNSNIQSSQVHYDNWDTEHTYGYTDEMSKINMEIAQERSNLDELINQKDAFYNEINEVLGADFNSVITEYNNDIEYYLNESESYFINDLVNIRDGGIIGDADKIDWMSNIIFEVLSNNENNTSPYTLDQIKETLSKNSNSQLSEDIYNLYLSAVSNNKTIVDSAFKKYDSSVYTYIDSLQQKYNSLLAGREIDNIDDCIAIYNMYNYYAQIIEQDIDTLTTTQSQLYYQTIMQSDQYKNFNYFKYNEASIEVHGDADYIFVRDSDCELSPIDYIYYIIELDDDMTMDYFLDFGYTQFKLNSGNAVASGDYIHTDTMQILNLIKASEYDGSLLTMYNYIYYTQGQTAANQFIINTESNVNETLAQVNVQKNLENMNWNKEYTFIDPQTGIKYNYTVIANNGKLIINGLGDGVQNFCNGLIGWFNTDSTKTVDEWEQYYMMLALMTPEDKEKYGLINSDGTSASPYIDFSIDYSQGGASTVVYNISSSIGNMLPSMVLSTVNPMLGTVSMGVGAGGNSFRDAITSGYSLENALVYGIASGASEAALERFLGSIPGLGKETENSIPGLSAWLMSCWDEGKEEFVQEGVDIVLRSILFGEEINVVEAIQQMGVAGLYGAATGGIMNGFSMPLSSLSIDSKTNGITEVLKQNNGELTTSQIAEMFGVDELFVTNIKERTTTSPVEEIPSMAVQQQTDPSIENFQSLSSLPTVEYEIESLAAALSEFTSQDKIIVKEISKGQNIFDINEQLQMAIEVISNAENAQINIESIDELNLEFIKKVQEINSKGEQKIQIKIDNKVYSDFEIPDAVGDIGFLYNMVSQNQNQVKFESDLAKIRQEHGEELIKLNQSDPDYYQKQSYIDQKLKLQQQLMESIHLQGMTFEEFVKSCGTIEQLDIQTQQVINNYAKQISDKAHQVEPNISAMMHTLETDGAKLAGFNERFKSESGIARKITTQYNGNIQDISYYANEINDSLRYTLILDESTYSSQMYSKLKTLKDNRYQIAWINNSWGKPGYQGVNCTLISPEGVKLELQFHTEGSFYTKEVLNHQLYEIARSTNAGYYQWNLANKIMEINQSLYVKTLEDLKGLDSSDILKNIEYHGKIVYTDIEDTTPYLKEIERAKKLDPNYVRYGNTELPAANVIDDIFRIAAAGQGDIKQGLKAIELDYGPNSIEAITSRGTAVQFFLANNPAQASVISTETDIAKRAREVFKAAGIEGFDVTLSNEYISYLEGLQNGTEAKIPELSDYSDKTNAAEYACRKLFRANFEYWKSHYSQAMKNFTGISFDTMNEVMRNNRTNESAGKRITELSQQLNENEKLSRRTINYRGIDDLNWIAEGKLKGLKGADLAKKINELGGAVISIGNSSFESSTPVMGQGFTDKSIVEVTSCPEGTVGSYIGTNSSCSNEVEYLLQAGSGNRKVILGADYINGQVFVYTEMIGN